MLIGYVRVSTAMEGKNSLSPICRYVMTPPVSNPHILNTLVRT